MYVNSKGLKIAYLSGIASKNSNAHEYSEQDISNLYDVCVRGNPSFRGVDILLTSQWPTNVTQNDPAKVILSWFLKFPFLKVWIILGVLETKQFKWPTKLVGDEIEAALSHQRHGRLLLWAPAISLSQSRWPRYHPWDCNAIYWISARWQSK